MQGSTKAPWRIQQVLRDIQHWQLMGCQFSFQQIFRKANRAADWIANFWHFISISHSLLTDSCFSSGLQILFGDQGCYWAFFCEKRRPLVMSEFLFLYPFQKQKKKKKKTPPFSF
uniref:RNase H type-1 domain-containing protein n=1 Tax=Opuntia streptacantha TaxID=393608 RepID=A0A7C8Z2D9_OPUST